MFQGLFDYLYHQHPTDGIPMKGTGIVLGLVLLGAHGWALLRGESTKAFLKGFPRSYPWGVMLLSIGFLWSMMIIQNMDMGEFFHLRRWFVMLVPIAFVGVLFYVREFISVRALGALMLLAAGPILTSAFLQPQVTRLLLPVLAYAWIVAGMFFVGTPYVMRDWVNWVTATEGRWKVAVFGGLGYGALLLVLAVATY